MEKTDWDNLVKRMFFWQWVIVAAGLAGGIAAWFFLGKNLPPQIPIYYSLPWGEDQLADKIFLWLPLVLGALIAGGVSLIVRWAKPDKVLASILLGTGMIAQILLILAILRTVLLIR